MFQSLTNRQLLGAVVIMVTMTAVLIRPEIRGYDGAGNFAYLMSLLGDGDFDFADDFRAIDAYRGPATKMMLLPISTETGKASNQFGIGSALFWSPAVTAVFLMSSFFNNDPQIGPTPVYAWAVALSTAVWTALGLILLLARLKQQFSLSASVLASFGIAVSTALIFYGWLHGSMSHGVSFFLSVLSMILFERAVQMRTTFALLALGVVTGLLAVTRYQDGVWLIAFGMVLLFRQSDSGKLRMDWRTAMLFTGGVALVLFPQMIMWNYLYGSWFSGPVPHFGYHEKALQWWPVHLLDVLYSGRGGVFFWHPILLVGLVGLVRYRGVFEKPFLQAAFVGMILQLYLIGSWSGWWGGASFGNRFFISSYPWICLGLGAVLHHLIERRGKRLAVFIVTLLSIWNAGLLIQYGLKIIPRSGEVVWTEIIINQFWQVPLALITYVLAP